MKVETFGAKQYSGPMLALEQSCRRSQCWLLGFARLTRRQRRFRLRIGQAERGRQDADQHSGDASSWLTSQSGPRLGVVRVMRIVSHFHKIPLQVLRIEIKRASDMMIGIVTRIEMQNAHPIGCDITDLLAG